MRDATVVFYTWVTLKNKKKRYIRESRIRLYFFHLQPQKLTAILLWHHAVHTTSWHLTTLSEVCCLHISGITAELIFTGWICKCDRRGGGLTAILWGIWCVVMLITASHHFHLSKSITAWWCIPNLSIPPSPTSSIYLPSVSPLCPIYFRWRCNMKQWCCRCDLWLQHPTSFVSPNSSFYPFLSCSIHPSISLSVCIYLFIYQE